jgi:hypothetical protein
MQVYRLGVREILPSFLPHRRLGARSVPETPVVSRLFNLIGALASTWALLSRRADGIAFLKSETRSAQLKGWTLYRLSGNEPTVSISRAATPASNP